MNIGDFYSGFCPNPTRPNGFIRAGFGGQEANPMEPLL